MSVCWQIEKEIFPELAVRTCQQFKSSHSYQQGTINLKADKHESALGLQREVGSHTHWSCQSQGLLLILIKESLQMDLQTRLV